MRAACARTVALDPCCFKNNPADRQAGAHDARIRRTSRRQPEPSIESINIAVWSAVGAAIGWAATQVQASTERIVFIETMAVAVFGSFIGGEFVAAMLRASSKDAALTGVAIALAVGCSMAGVLLLVLMRRAVGPLGPKPKRRR